MKSMLQAGEELLSSCGQWFRDSCSRRSTGCEI